MSRRTRYALLMMLFVASVCTTAKMTTDAVKNQYEEVLSSRTVATEAIKTDAISQFRLEREQLRNLQKSQLNEIIHNEDSDVSVVKSAQEQLMKMLEDESNETEMEGILKMRGYNDAVTVINGDSLSVMIRTDTLSGGQTAAILDIIADVKKFSLGNVKIIPIN